VERSASRIRRTLAAVTAGGPGLVLLTFYGLRLAALSRDPSAAPGGSGETTIALLVAAFAVASFLFARAAFSGRLSRAMRAFGVITFAEFGAGLCFGVLLLS
jgi:hypothetical protein